MKTISLRYTDKFAPGNGTIEAHKAIIDAIGYAWYGKMGPPISEKVANIILDNSRPRFLLVHSGAQDRYWVYIDKISREQPPFNEFPAYYSAIAKDFKTWFRIVRIENAEKNVMAKCTVSSSGATLSEASRHSMSPYFIIEYQEHEGMPL